MNTLNVGNEVGIYKANGYSIPFIGYVVKVSPNGTRATVQVADTTRMLQFNVNTRTEIGAKHYNGYRLMDATLARNSIAEKEKQRQDNHNVTAILEAINGMRTGMGNYVMSAERKAELLALVEAL
jgi:hypothetical protein